MSNIIKGDKKTIRSWVMYDWANSVYNLVITSAIFPLFYGGITEKDGIIKEVGGFIINGKLEGSEQVVFVNFFGYEMSNTVLISYVTALGFLLVSIMSPFLSGVADYIGRKKMFLRIFAYIGSFSCMGLYFFNLDNLELGLLFYLLALIGFWGSLVFYNAYLPEIAEKKDHDRISARGFSFGYVGSTILLSLCLYMIMGLKRPAEEAFLLTGLWWFGFSHIFFFRVREVKQEKKVSSNLLFNGFREIKKVWRELKTKPRLKRFLSSFFVYSMGVQTVMLIATYFASKEISWGEGDKQIGLIVSILLIQLVAIPGAIGMSRLSEKYGNIKTIQFVVVIWAILSVWAYFIQTPIQFYITAAFVGLVMGGIQSLSRSTYSKFIPETTDTSSYFSFYDSTEKIGIVIGMFMFGFLEALTGSMRNSILVIASFFVIGFILLMFVPKEVKE